MKKKSKIIILVIIAALLLVLALSGTKLFLYINFLIGKDIIVSLEPSKEFVTIPHGEKETIEFKAKVTTNPFCSAVCNSVFYDISNDKLIEEDEFLLKTGLSETKSYEITSPNLRRSMGLYRFSMECYSVSNSLCHTSGEPTTRDVLVTANFTLNEDEKLLKKHLEETIDLLSWNIGSLINKINTIQEVLIDASVNVDVENTSNEITIIDNSSLNLEKEFLEIEKDWKGEDYTFVKSKFENINNSFNGLNNEFFDIENRTIFVVSEYNLLIDKLNESKFLLEDFKTRASEENEGVIFERIIEFNTAVERFSNKELIENKSLFVNDIYDKVNNIFNISNNITINISLSEVNFEKLKIDEFISKKTIINLEEALPQCCVFGECSSCCVTEECNSNEDLFPIVFLHGHAVSESVSIDYSLEGFRGLQKRMEDDGYLNAGTITIYTNKDTPEGSLGVVNAPLTIRASYYFDLFKEPENYVVVQRKSENIDTYAVRLKEVLDTIMFKTGKDKVNIVAFSMGGLVTRRYIQIFGSDDVDKVILVGTPNKGITGDVRRFCSLTGSDLECRDMNEDSLFINKLNHGNFPEVEIHNIIGTGCNMKDGIGDGIVLEKNAFLDTAENYIIRGDCRSIVQPLHLDLLDINKYPEVYGIIKSIFEK